MALILKLVKTDETTTTAAAALAAGNRESERYNLWVCVCVCERQTRPGPFIDPKNHSLVLPSFALNRLSSPLSLTIPSTSFSPFPSRSWSFWVAQTQDGPVPLVSISVSFVNLFDERVLLLCCPSSLTHRVLSPPYDLSALFLFFLFSFFFILMFLLQPPVFFSFLFFSFFFFFF